MQPVVRKKSREQLREGVPARIAVMHARFLTSSPLVRGCHRCFSVTGREQRGAARMPSGRGPLSLVTRGGSSADGGQAGGGEAVRQEAEAATVPPPPPEEEPGPRKKDDGKKRRCEWPTIEQLAACPAAGEGTEYPLTANSRILFMVLSEEEMQALAEAEAGHARPVTRHKLATDVAAFSGPLFQRPEVVATGPIMVPRFRVLSEEEQAGRSEDWHLTRRSERIAEIYSDTEDESEEEDEDDEEEVSGLGLRGLG